MKTIIKYELVINEALRSALNYHTPDEHKQNQCKRKVKDRKNAMKLI